MVAAGILHAVLNWKTLVGHLRLRGPMALGVLLAVVMVLLFIEGFTRPVDREAVRKVEEIVSAARQAERGD
jgi:hypothetical protein